MTKLNETTELTVPLKNIIGMLVFTAAGVMGYFNLTERIAFLEHKVEKNIVQIDENTEWVNTFEPPKAVLDTVKRVR